MKNTFYISVALLLCAMTYSIGVLTGEFSYYTNDDYGIQSVLSGSVPGSPYPYMQFINVILSQFISKLYLLVPQVQWWFVWSQLLMCIGLYMFFYFSIRLIDIETHKELVILYFFFLGKVAFYIRRTTWTVVPAILLCGCIALVMYASQNEKVKESLYRKKILSFVILLLMLATIHRLGSGLVGLCFVLLVYLYMYYCAFGFGKEMIIRYLICMFTLLLTIILVIGVDKTVKYRVYSNTFRDFDSARALFTDYPHDTFEENPQLYEKTGWNEESYKLVENWIFIPQCVNESSLRYIVENSSKNGIDERISIVYKNIQNVMNCSLFKPVLILSFLLLAFILVGSQWKASVFFFLNTIGGSTLLLYLCYKGRAIERVNYIIFLYMAVVDLCLIFITISKSDIYSFNINFSEKKNIFLFKRCAVILICIFVLYTFGKTWYNLEKENTSDAYMIEKYVIENHNNVYMYIPAGIYNPIDIYTLHIEQKPTNLIPMGGSTWLSDVYEIQMAINNLRGFENGKVFQQPNVYIIHENSWEEEHGNALQDDLIEYLKNYCGATGYKLVDKIEQTDVGIYKIEFEP